MCCCCGSVTWDWSCSRKSLEIAADSALADLLHYESQHRSAVECSAGVWKSTWVCCCSGSDGWRSEKSAWFWCCSDTDAWAVVCKLTSVCANLELMILLGSAAAPHGTDESDGVFALNYYETLAGCSWRCWNLWSILSSWTKCWLITACFSAPDGSTLLSSFKEQC